MSYRNQDRLPLAAVVLGLTILAAAILARAGSPIIGGSRWFNQVAYGSQSAYWTNEWTSSLVLRFDMNPGQTNATQMLDLSPEANNASNRPNFTAGPGAGIVGTNVYGDEKGIWSLNGAGQYWQLQSDSTLSMVDSTGTNDCSYTCWWWMRHDVPNGASSTIFCKGAGAGSYEGRLSLNDRYLEVYEFNRGNGAVYAYSRTDDRLPTNEWMFCALAKYPGETNLYNWYIAYETDTVVRVSGKGYNAKSGSYISMSNCNASAYLGAHWAGGSAWYDGDLAAYAILKGTGLVEAQLSVVFTNTRPRVAPGFIWETPE